MTDDGLVTVLRFVSGRYRGQDFPLDDRRSYIAGRSSEVDLVLADDAVSRKHARFYPARGRIWVRDLGSRNGTIINGQTVERHCLREGDRIAIGSSLAKVARAEPGVLSTKRAGEVRESAAASMSSRAMAGSLEEVPLMDVLQWLATSRKTGTLEVRDPDAERVGSLHLRDGRVFYAAITGAAELAPEKALLRMLNWRRGSFELDSAVMEDVKSEINMSLEHMLMEAARQEDELANLAKKSPLPKPRARVALVKPCPVRWRALEPAELDLVQDMVEMGSWWRVLDHSTTDDLTLSRVLVGLKKKGVVEY
jgi:pSer/pThr/pTyr-binding forkhead associated (FHA) protein